MITRNFPRSSNTYVDQGSRIVTPRLLSPAALAFSQNYPEKKKSHTGRVLCQTYRDWHVGWCCLALPCLAFRLLLVSGTSKIRLFPTAMNLD